MQDVTVCVILVNYGNWDDTIECYESIKKNTFRNYNVITVDVANKNGSFQKLNDWHKNNIEQFHLLRLDENKGFAYANNFAVNYADGNLQAEFIWILNNDTIIDAEALEALIEYYEKHSQTDKIGFIGSKIMEYESPEIIQTVGGSFNKKTGYSVLIGKGETDKEQYDNITLKPDYVIGASMFFHIDLLKEIGFMPEDYFLYYEDIDWCLTAKFKCFTNYTCTKSLIFHKQGKSTGNKYTKKTSNLTTRKYLYSSYLKLYRKHFKNYLYIAYLILIKQLAGRLFHLQFKEAYIIIKTIFGK